MGQQPLDVIIPAAGCGRRMRSPNPKSLIEVAGGRAIITRQLDLLASVFPQARFTIVLGYQYESVVKRLPAGVRVVLNETHHDTNVARSIELGLLATPCERAIIVYGDLVFNKATLTGLDLSRGSLAVVDTRGQMGPAEVGVTIVNGRVTAFEYGLTTKWAQIVYLERKDLVVFRRLLSSPVRRRHFGYEVLNDLIDEGAKISAVEPEGMRITDVDVVRDVETACSIC